MFQRAFDLSAFRRKNDPNLARDHFRRNLTAYRKRSCKLNRVFTYILSNATFQVRVGLSDGRASKESNTKTQRHKATTHGVTLGGEKPFPIEGEGLGRGSVQWRSSPCLRVFVFDCLIQNIGIIRRYSGERLFRRRSRTCPNRDWRSGRHRRAGGTSA